MNGRCGSVLVGGSRNGKGRRLWSRRRAVRWTGILGTPRRVGRFFPILLNEKNILLSSVDRTSVVDLVIVPVAMQVVVSCYGIHWIS